MESDTAFRRQYKMLLYVLYLLNIWCIYLSDLLSVSLQCNIG